jgi:F0F1-type ATP synthase epsilon subunit
MDFILLTPERNYVISDLIRIKASLKNGAVEVLDKHQFLMGLIENNLIEIESKEEAKQARFFVVQDAIFIVADAHLGLKESKNSTVVYVYAKTFIEILKNTSIETFSLYYENKKKEFDQEILQLNNNSTAELNLVLNSRALLLKEEVEFYFKVLQISKKVCQENV